jgi:hypothetical protein
MLATIRTLATIATGSMLLLGASSSAQATAELFISQCGGCHNNVKHPLNLVYNAAGNAAIIETVNALGMGASGLERTTSALPNTWTVSSRRSRGRRLSMTLPEP